MIKNVDLGIAGLGPAIRIGLGGSAIVYRARQTNLNRDVAIKLLTNQDPSFVRRFEREAKMLGRLSRLPGIVTIHESGFTDNDEPYLILEYCPSSLLDRIYRDGPYPAEKAAKIISQVAATVAEAQAEGIIHRDLKPANILLNEADEPLISDFGISSVLGGTGNLSTSVGFTPGYVAPETLTGEQGESPVDVYALGATLFHLITGHAPYMESAGEGSNLLALANRINSEPVPDLRPAGVPEHICVAIEQAMAKDPNHRPTAQQLAAMLSSEPTDRLTGSPRPPAPNRGPVPALGPTRPKPDGPRPAVDSAGRDATTKHEFEQEVFLPPRPAVVGVDDRAPSPPASVSTRRVQRSGTSRWAVAGITALFVVPLLAIVTWLADDSSGFDVAATTTSFPSPVVATTSPAFIPTTSGPSSGDGLPSTLGGYSDRWEAERARIIFNLEAQYGLGADGVVEGPAGFEIDTTTCPAGWSDTEGVTEDVVTIGFVNPQPGDENLDPLVDGIGAYFDWVNDNGGIGPDGLLLTTALADQQGLVTDGVFSVATTDTAAGLAVYDTLNESCVPHPFAAGRHPAWGDPIGHPWTTGLERSYRSEAAAWVALIEESSEGSVSVAALVADNEVGSMYEESFRTAAAASDKIVITTEVVPQNSNATSIRPVVEQLAATVPDVFIAMADDTSCLMMVEAMDPASWQEVTRIMASECRSSTVNASMDGLWDEGWVVLDDGLQTASPTLDSPLDLYNPFVEFTQNQLFAQDLDPMFESHGLGFALYGWAYHQALEIAARLPGGLTRTNFVLAQRAMSGMTVPQGVAGISFGMNGNADPYFLEGALLLTHIEDGVWMPGRVLNLEGNTPPCRWDPQQGCGT